MVRQMIGKLWIKTQEYYVSRHKSKQRLYSIYWLFGLSIFLVTVQKMAANFAERWWSLRNNTLDLGLAHQCYCT